MNRWTSSLLIAFVSMLTALACHWLLQAASVYVRATAVAVGAGIGAAAAAFIVKRFLKG